MKIRELEKGELASILIFTIIGIIVFILSFQIYIKNPVLSSQGAFPLLLGILMLIMSALMIFELKKYDKATYTNGSNVSGKVKELIEYLFPGKILPVIILIVFYAIALPRVGFIISTFLYLFLSMAMLKTKDIIKSLLASAVSVAFILIVFQFIFKVILP